MLVFITSSCQYNIPLYFHHFPVSCLGIPVFGLPHISLSWESLQQFREKHSCFTSLKCLPWGTKRHCHFLSWSFDAEPQHPFHIFIWDHFPFTVKQMSFQILKPFKHFLWVSTLIWKTLNEIQYSLFNNNVIFTHLSICTPGCSPSCNYFL